MRLTSMSDSETANALDEFSDIRDDFVARRGFWSPEYEAILRLDPEYLRALGKYAAIPSQHGHLDPKAAALVLLAVDASVTHLYAPGIRCHIREALRLGATQQEIMEVIELVASIGVHAALYSAPVLLEAVEDFEAERRSANPGTDGIEPDRSPEELSKIRTVFLANRGFWGHGWEAMLKLDPDFVEGYSEFSAIPSKHGYLEPKIREFVYIAIDVAVTHIFESGIKLHFGYALKMGATKQEIMEVVELASSIGAHTALVAAPILAEEAAAYEASQR
jgi:alkylhydroperoxidase/carboxymuconolactone decarboxylase family protein YurZ